MEQENENNDDVRAALDAEERQAEERHAVEDYLEALRFVADRYDRMAPMLSAHAHEQTQALARKLLKTQAAAESCKKLEAVNGTIAPCRPRPDGGGCVWCGKPC